MMREFSKRGWVSFKVDPLVLKWVTVARPFAEQAAQDPDLQKAWLRCDGTWFVGVNALPNGPDGRIGDAALAGLAVEFASSLADKPIEWDRAQVSVCYPGYPRQGAEESAAAFGYRKKRDAAHVDGVHRAGPQNRRFVREFHQFILGIALGDSPPTAAPFVVWDGSHQVMQSVFREALGNVAVCDWPDVDVTEIYQAARRQVFERCARVELPLRLGEAYVVHRHALHGVAPWAQQGAQGDRMIAYFRPEGRALDWL